MTATHSTNQDYSAYASADYAVWRKLATRQLTALKKVACKDYNGCMKALYPTLSPDHPPRFTDLNRVLSAAHGWSIKVVPGLLPVDEFFVLLSQRRFCSSTWLRNQDQLDYLEEPDMFHDIFGHIPLYLNADYAEFARKLGALGVKFKDDEEKVIQLQRIYWFTIEFGMIYEGDNKDLKVYGAGICSSSGETKHIYENPKVEVIPFDLDEVITQDFISTEVQMKYFAINSFVQLWEVIEELEARWTE